MTKRLKQFLVVSVIATAAITACQTGGIFEPNATRAMLDESNSLIESMETKADEQEARILAMEEGADKTKNMIALVDSREEIANMRKLQAEFEKYVDEQGNIDTGGALVAITNSLPPPWNVFAGIGVGGLLDWWRNRKTRTAFGKLVVAFNTAKLKHPEFASAMNVAGGTIRDGLGASAGIINTMRKNGGKPPIL